MNRRITQHDVAKAANVSRSIVSLVINGRDAGRVSEPTRQAVFRAIKQLGYVPNAAARLLAAKQSFLIGVFTYEELFPYAVDDFFHAFLVGIEHQASQEQYNLLLFTRKGDYSTRSIYQGPMNVLGAVDGSILMGSHPNEQEIRDLVREKRPFVYIGQQQIAGCAFDWVASDYRQGAYLATKHLIDLGHRSIGLLGLWPDMLHDRSKHHGARQAVGEAPDARLFLLPRRTVDDPDRLNPNDSGAASYRLNMQFQPYIFRSQPFAPHRGCHRSPSPFPSFLIQ